MSDHVPGPPALTRQLRALKRRGCTLLVVGDARTTPAACRRFLGSAALDRRYVFLPTTTSVPDALARCSVADPDRIGVVDASTAARTRSAAAPGPARLPDRRDLWYSRVESLSDVRGVLDRVAHHFDRVAPADPDPGDVRLCVESLDPFLDELDGETLFELVHLLGGAVRRVRGMGHFHVASSTRPMDVRTLEPLFDATVRVEAGDDGPRHRWSLHESGYETAWLPLHRD